MPRTSDTRPPAEPSSQGQKLRYRRMLDAAVKLGSVQDFERVQMQDVAAESEVAIATLYRYFPSKVHLFVGVMKAAVDGIDPSAFEVREDQDPVEVIGDLLMQFTRTMCRNRRLSMSMMQAMILSEGLDSPDSITIESLFLDLLLGIAGWAPDATEDQRRRCWLVIQCWFGVLVTTLAGERPIEESETDVRRACDLLLR
ncbi:TetR/AcrR family transcriptional regulator [Nocardioides marmoriginsengisoli]|uniref:TetR/AcrR family transcriptional regulator n=1 Tax=Nocardioides marmoriginsengisoli TaxID=661483 RepID=A0A3N0CGU0_9ACTN|nr:TetR family transcriptional regulator [Nocardioides marmoriginsengisoli]RNL62672.1 TetR/AcrR family transcriptional regulator [Nocardioides marmoriginsengisoli]